MTSLPVTGGCQGGRIRCAVSTADDAAYLRHCRKCRRTIGGIAAALRQVPRSAFAWLTRAPHRYGSSPITERGFCATCGTPLPGGGDGSSDLDLTIGSFDALGRFPPVEHMSVECRHDAWADTRALPASRTADNPNTAKWIETCGKLPD